MGDPIDLDAAIREQQQTDLRADEKRKRERTAEELVKLSRVLTPDQRMVLGLQYNEQGMMFIYNGVEYNIRSLSYPIYNYSWSIEWRDDACTLHTWKAYDSTLWQDILRCLGSQKE